MLGRHRIPSATVIAPHEIDAIVADCDRDILPTRLFAFVGSRLALPGHSIAVTWDDTDDLTVNGQALHYRFVFDDAGQVTAIGLHPEVNDLPYRLAAVTAVAAAEYFIKTESMRKFYTALCIDGAKLSILVLKGMAMYSVFQLYA